jgi:hypothetical protein
MTTVLTMVNLKIKAEYKINKIWNYKRLLLFGLQMQVYRKFLMLKE